MPTTVQEGNLGAVKCSDDFGGPNQWELLIRTVSGTWEQVAWDDVSNIQRFFKTKLPIYEKVSKAKYRPVVED